MSTENSLPSVLGPTGSPTVQGGQHATKLGRSLYSGRALTLLRQAIVDGSLVSGTPLIETQLAARLAVSRGPIRSALSVLESEGLAETLPNGRMVVVGLLADDVRDLLAVRFEVEVTAVRWGLARSAHLDDVERALREIELADASDQHLVALDLAFHRALVALGGSRFLLRSWSALEPVIQTVIATGNRRLGDQDPKTHLARIVHSHTDLARALRARDAEAVAAKLQSQFELTASMFDNPATRVP
ncbi:MAG: GntR family transcriptional regulator [Gaiella sp.]